MHNVRSYKSYRSRTSKKWFTRIQCRRYCKSSPKIKEGTRERVQVFEGTVLKRQNGGARETFTVRRVAYNVAVEKTFPVNSPLIEKIQVVRKGKVRRAKLYYLRDRVGKAAKVKERI